MFGRDWSTSPRRYGVRIEEDFEIPVSDGIRLRGVMFRPDTDEPVPILAGFHAYNNEFQLAPIMPAGFSFQRGWLEAGDPSFFARRGYAHGVFNVRGTGRSTGEFQAMGPREVQDVAEAIEWLAARPWCTGAVGTFGISYLAWIQLQVAMLEPAGLKAIFAPFGLTDFYRDFLYHGGILSHRFLLQWKDKFDGLRYRSRSLEREGEEAHRAAVARALDDDDLVAVPELARALAATGGADAFVADVLLHPLDDWFYGERNVDYSRTGVPAYLGACWGLYGLHLPGAFRSWERWRGPKKLLVGPALYLDRPLYQLQYESLRWFDHWLKGNDTGFMDEPPVRLFLPGTGTWRAAEDWPLPQTRWTPFFLHERGLLSEHDLWPGESSTAFEDSPFHHGGVEFLTPELVEATEVIGPMVLRLHAATTDVEALLFATVFVVRADGTREELSRGWLRGSHLAVDPERSAAWLPHHPHDRTEPLTPGRVHEFEIGIAPAARLLLPGERLGLRIKAADDEAATDAVRAAALGHLHRQTAARIVVHHSEDHPSCLAVPVTAGNHLGTFLSGGHLPPPAGPIPLAKIQRQKVPSADADADAGADPGADADPDLPG